VEKGSITLGYELHRSLDLAVGETTRLMGREFTVSECYDERGDRDDITAWIHLEEAQELLDKAGLLNAILALECLCTGDVPLAKLREEITGILPGTKVVERGSRALARAETRLKLQQEAQATLAEEEQNREAMRRIREEFASFLIPVIYLACGIWIAFLGLMNSRTRREEIGILRAFGISGGKVLQTFLLKYLMVGICGGIPGFFGGVITGFMFGRILEGEFIWIGPAGELVVFLAILAVLGSSILAIAAGWIPALLATRQDPAEILHAD
jgi:putative ABC transport system permease protein